MKKFCIISNDIKDPNLALMRQIKDYIRQKGGQVQGIAAHEGGRRKLEFDRGKINTDTDMILVLGGDGTLIRAATLLGGQNIPMIGVNLGNVGYLCELDRETVFSGIDRMMDDCVTIEERMMLCGRRDGEEKSSHALNEIVIHHIGECMTVVRLVVSVNGEYLSTYEADGLILATPTGSTGYNMSAGGPIVEPNARMILLTPINAHNLSSKSIVFGADDTVCIEVKRRRADLAEQACVSFDGDLLLRLSEGERLIVSAAKDMAHIGKLHKESFLEMVRRKL